MADARVHPHGRSHPEVDSRTHRILAWIGVALRAAALIAVLLLERRHGLPSLATFLVLSIAFLAAQDRLPSLISLLVVVAALINAVGWAWNIFNQVTFYDEFVHAFSSFAVVAALGYLAWTRGYLDAKPGSAKFVLAVTVGGFVLGVLWEMVEMTFLDLTWTDTLVDLLMDTIGAAVAAAFVGWVIRRQGPHRTA